MNWKQKILIYIKIHRFLTWITHFWEKMKIWEYKKIASDIKEYCFVMRNRVKYWKQHIQAPDRGAGNFPSQLFPKAWWLAVVVLYRREDQVSGFSAVGVRGNPNNLLILHFDSVLYKQSQSEIRFWRCRNAPAFSADGYNKNNKTIYFINPE